MNQLAIMESKIEVLCRQLDDKDLELKTVRIAHAVEKDIMQTNFTRCKQAAEYWKAQAKDLHCCGNCKKYVENRNCYNMRPGSYCYEWASDGLTRKDRE